MSFPNVRQWPEEGTLEHVLHISILKVIFLKRRSWVIVLKCPKFYKPEKWNLGHVLHYHIFKVILLKHQTWLVESWTCPSQSRSQSHAVFSNPQTGDGAFSAWLLSPERKTVETKFSFRLFSFFTWSFLSVEREPQLIMLSRVRSAISSKLLAAMSKLTWSSQMLEACSLLFARCFLLFVDCLFMSRPTVPFNRRDRSSKSEWSDKVATWGLLHLFPPSSTSSSNLTHLRNSLGLSEKNDEKVF